MPRPLRSTLASVLVGAMVVSGCSGSSDDTNVAAEELPVVRDWQDATRAEMASSGTVTLATDVLPSTFNTSRAADTVASATKILAPTTGSAVSMTDRGAWRVDPNYATSVKVAGTSPLTIEVSLNPRAVWQGGASITTDDMVAYWQALNGSDSDFDVASTAGWDDISAIEPGSDEFSYTVVFDQPRADWPLFIYPKLPASISTSAKKFNDGFKKAAPPSNGPFQVKRIRPKTGTIRLVRNPRWWGATPQLDSVVWRIAAPDVQVEAYAAEELDAVELNASTYGLGKDTGTVRRVVGLDWSQLTLNAGRGPLRQVKVRRAVALAIDRQAIADNVAGEFDSPSWVMDSVVYVPGHRSYAGAGREQRNIDRAAKLLTDAGYTRNADGAFERNGELLTLTLPVPSGTAANAARAQLIADQLAEVGITVELDNVPAAKFFTSRVVSLNFDMVTFTWRSAAFVSESTKARFYPIDSPQNFTAQGDEALGEAFDAAIAGIGAKKKSKALGKAVDQAVLENQPMIPLAVTPLVMATRDGLVNYGPATFRTIDWTKVGFVQQ